MHCAAHHVVHAVIESAAKQQDVLQDTLASNDMEHPTLLSSRSLSSCWKRRLEGWWMVVTMALPPFAKSLRVDSKCMAVVLSRPETGSTR